MIPADVNAPVPQDDQPTTPGDPATEKVYRMVMSLHAEGKKHREKYDKNWPKYRNYYDGNQWEQKRPAYKASPNVNVIWPTVQTILPIMTDTSPGFDVLPTAPRDFDFSDMLSKALKVWWKNRGCDMTILEGILDSLITDYGILKVTWNPDLEEGLGDVEITAVAPEKFYFPKGAVDIDKKCPWVIHEVDKRVGELRRLFPQFADKIKPSKFSGEGFASAESARTPEDIVMISPIDQKSSLSQENMTDVQGGSGEDNQNVTIFECWMDDFSVEDYQYENNEGKPVTGKKLKYPKGRLITVIPGSGLVLQDKENPRKDGRKPFIRIVDVIRLREFCGKGEVEPQLENQKIINKTVATVLDWMNAASNPVWILDDNSGVNPEMITNQIGLIITKKANSSVTRQAAPELSDKFFQFYNLMTSFNDTTTGVHDITQGRKPAGITAAEAIDTLQEAAQTRIRLKERNLRNSLHQLGMLVIADIMQFYTTPRMFRLTGKEGWPEYFEFYIEPTDQGYVYHSRDIPYDPVTKKYGQSSDWTAGQPSKGIFSLDVVTGTSLPYQKDVRSRQAERLFDKKAIDQEELLTTLEWPHKEQLIKRMQQAIPQQPMSGKPQ